MMDRPIILFPEPVSADRAHKPSGFPRTAKPTFHKQYDRLRPEFTLLQNAFEEKRVKLQQSTSGINPEFALVFDIVGTVANFYTAVNKCDGLEWMFDAELDEIEPDEDFYEIKDGKRIEKDLKGKVYCVMSNQQAMNQLLSLWERYKNCEEAVFERGFTGLKDVFTQIKDVRKWSSLDRIEETCVMEYWKENLELDGNIPTKFEIELFYRQGEAQQNNSANLVKSEIVKMQGRVLQEVVISEIAYHTLLVELPRQSIEQLVNSYYDIDLVEIDDIMFFRPISQSAFDIGFENEKMEDIPNSENVTNLYPVVAVFDGMPIQNHPILKNRVIIDDPDEYEKNYESKYRSHGTAMTSLVIYGDLNYRDTPINSPVYVRPILRPKEVGIEQYLECVPEDRILVDVIHRAVRRMMVGDGENNAMAPTVKIVNLSIGDPVRQLATTMSPLARLLDYLAFTYKLLFIVSAGNHAEILDKLDVKFSEFKKMSEQERAKAIFSKVKENQRNMKVLSPAESINSITVGALYSDGSDIEENVRQAYAVSNGMPSPVSAFGKGYNSIITPDLFYYGGRKQIKSNYKDELLWAITNRAPGCRVAAPFENASETGQCYTFGTSDAAAQLSHAGVKCNEVLNELFITETGEMVPREYSAIMLKAMLTHGASWDGISDILADSLDVSSKQLARWLGNGVPNISKVEECARNRVTLIGMGNLKKEEGHVFNLPLPLDFSSKLIKRRLTVTLAYFTPIEAKRQAYRTMQLWFTIEEGEKLVPNRVNTEWQAVRKGTLQHEIFEGESPEVWNDNDIVIKVNCKEDAGKYKNGIPYCMFVSFEIAEGQDIDLYSVVKTKIKQKVSVNNA